MKYIILVIFVAIILLALIISLENQLSDCQFECNHLQTKLYWLQELSDYIYVMEQILPPKVLAQFKAANLMIRNERYKAYEGIEQPLLTEKERK